MKKRWSGNGGSKAELKWWENYPPERDMEQYHLEKQYWQKLLDSSELRVPWSREWMCWMQVAPCGYLYEFISAIYGRDGSTWMNMKRIWRMLNEAIIPIHRFAACRLKNIPTKKYDVLFAWIPSITYQMLISSYDRWRNGGKPAESSEWPIGAQSPFLKSLIPRQPAIFCITSNAYAANTNMFIRRGFNIIQKSWNMSFSLIITMQVGN